MQIVTLLQSFMQINKKELVSAVHQELVSTLGDGNARSFKKQGVEEVLNALVEVVQRSVANGDKVVLSGFLTLERVEREARTGRNPATGEEMAIAAKSAPKVTIGKSFRQRVAA